MHVCRVDLALDDVEDGDVAGLLRGVGGDHAVLGLEEAAHNVEDGGFADCLGGLEGGAGEWRIGGHQEMAAGGRDKTGNDGDEVVVHVSWVS